MSGITDDALRRLRAVSDAPDLSGTPYEPIERLAAGGMGVVWRARDRELDRDVAVKVLSGVVSRAACERLLREARILARLEHPGIIPVHDVGTLPDGRAYYAMKLVKGSRLDEHARTLDSLPELLRLFARITEPVAFAHAHGVVHRDLKPANVMVGAFGEVLVLDWGVAKILGSSEPEETEPRAPDEDEATAPLPSKTGAGAVLGTPGFMSPEQATGATSRVGPASDVFALGRILGALLAQKRLAAPKRLAAVLDRATAPDVEARYQSVADLAKDVALFLDGVPPSAYPEGALERVGRFVHHYRTPLGLVAAYLAIRLLVFFFAGT